MCSDDSERSLLDSRRAAGIVNALIEQDWTTCGDCGERVDLHGATEPMEVVAELEAHRQDCDEKWFDETDTDHSERGEP